MRSPHAFQLISQPSHDLNTAMADLMVAKEIDRNLDAAIYAMEWGADPSHKFDRQPDHLRVACRVAMRNDETFNRARPLVERLAAEADPELLNICLMETVIGHEPCKRQSKLMAILTHLGASVVHTPLAGTTHIIVQQVGDASMAERIRQLVALGWVPTRGTEERRTLSSIIEDGKTQALDALLLAYEQHDVLLPKGESCLHLLAETKRDLRGWDKIISRLLQSGLFDDADPSIESWIEKQDETIQAQHRQGKANRLARQTPQPDSPRHPRMRL